VGPDRGALSLSGPATSRLDLTGRTVIPGMIDAHGHLMTLGKALRTVDLTGTRSYEVVIEGVVARARTVPLGEWILGRGWDQNDWSSTAFPTHDALSQAVPDHPVLLERVDGHAMLANAAAMRLANLTSATPDPAGGRVLRDAARQPTGVLVDDAVNLVERVVPPPGEEERQARALAALAELNRWGLTGVHDAGVSPAEIATYRALARDGRFTIRDYVMVDDTSAAGWFRRGVQAGLDGGHLWIRAVKAYADGALGSRGAALLEAYSDDPGNRGLILTEGESLRHLAVGALRAGFQLNGHAIGDRANRMVLDAFETAFAEVPVADPRFRIEHAQVVNAADIPRFAALGVIPSMQGSHQTSDMYWAVERLGAGRALGAYAWRSLLNTGVILPNGSDFPVESPNPLLSFRAFFTRQDPSGWPPGGWYPAQRTTREEALLAVTLWPARASFMEADVGSLAPGKYADFVVLDRDIMTADPADVLGARVLRTVLGGRTVYEADARRGAGNPR
jgi:predicted amidohydrolase YtcJ